MSQSFGVGTPPTSRRVSPAPRRRASADQRNSVVPFTRPGSSGKLADSQNSSFERSFRPSVPAQSQSQPQPVLTRPSFSRISFDSQAPQQRQSSSSFSAPSNPADSPFSRQEGFAASISHALAERGSQAVLASPPESPGRAKSTSLLSQQLNRESSLSLKPADVKVWHWSATACLPHETGAILSHISSLSQKSLETCHSLPSALPASIKTSTSLEDLQVRLLPCRHVCGQVRAARQIFKCFCRLSMRFFGT